MLQEKDPVRALMEEEMMQNHAEIAWVNKLIDTVFLLYAGTCILYAVATLFLIAVLVDQDFLFMCADGIFVKGVLLLLCFLSCYKHRSVYAIIGVVLQGGVIAAGIINSNDTFFADVSLDISLLIFIMFLLFTVLIVIGNGRYHYLENQPGFPYFNIRIEEMKKISRKNKLKDPYEQRKKELQRNSSENMVWLSKKETSGDTGRDDLNSQADMDNI